MARPKLDIDGAEVEKLASYGCTPQEIADFFGCSDETIRNRFLDDITKGRTALKTRLRKKQIEVALKGNTTMLIWLGKHILQQIETQDILLHQNGPQAKPLDKETLLSVVKTIREGK